MEKQVYKMKKFTYELDKLNTLPEKPGIYFMKDKEERVIYVGKSKCLKKRVKSYFFNLVNRSRKIERMIKNISHIDIIVTDTEFDALLLECKYIHEIKPMYNTLLKNYEKYKYLCINTKDHNIITVKDDIDLEGIYFGPYSFGRKISDIKDILVKVYKLPICQKQNKCIRYDLNKCIAPCRGKVKEEFKYKISKSIQDNLNSNSDFVIEKLKCEMNEHIQNLKFEEASIVKKEIDLFSSIIKRQKSLSNLNRDIVFWIKLENYNYKIYYISGFESQYEKIIDARKPSQIDEVKTNIRDLISNKKEKKKALQKEEIDYINIINEYIKDKNDRGYFVI